MSLPNPTGPDPQSLFSWARNLTAELSKRFAGSSLSSGRAQVAAPGALPAGCIQAFIGSSIPNGWLECNGTVLDRVQYANLFKVLGTRFNTGGETATQFRLPDARGRTLRGLVANETTGGSDTVAIAQANLPTNVPLSITDPGHTHVFNGASHTHGVTDPGHAHTIGGSPMVAGGSVNVGSGGTAVNVGQSGVLGTMSSATNITVQGVVAGGTNQSSPTGITATLNGGGTAVNIVPSYFAARWIIKT